MKKILYYIKACSGILQKKESSYTQHHSEYIEPGKLEHERMFAKKQIDEKAYDNNDNKITRLLTHYPERALCVDIGSGNGWYSGYMSQFFKQVIGIEPSVAAIEIAKNIHPKEKYPNILWIQGFAEDKLNSLPEGFSINTTPTLFITGCVLSHMRDKEVAAICKILNTTAKKGSALSLSECWGDSYNKLMWHVRTKEWWQKHLSNWELDFHGNMVENTPGRYKGIHGIKIS